jgi:hypothetical protein
VWLEGVETFMLAKKPDAELAGAAETAFIV